MRMIHRRIVGAFIISSDGYLLLGKNRVGGVYEGQWTIPGGGIEEGKDEDEDEDEVGALNREIYEETSLDISTAKIIELEGTRTGESIKIKDGIEVAVTMRFYDFVVLLDTAKDNVEVVAGDDFRYIHWFSSVEIESLDIAPPAHRRIREIIAKKLL